MQHLTIELGPRQVELALKSIEIVRRTLIELEDDDERNIDTTEELSRIWAILSQAHEQYKQAARDVQLPLY